MEKIIFSDEIKLEVPGVFFDVQGSGNKIIIDDSIFSGGGYFRDCHFVVNGNNNFIKFNKIRYARFLDVFVTGNEQRMLIDDGVSFEGTKINLCSNKSNLSVGKDCMISSDTEIWTGDGHQILNLRGEVINNNVYSVMINDRCWIGHKSIILKGASIAHTTIVGCGSVVSSQFAEPYVAIGGNPCRIIKRDVMWRR